MARQFLRLSRETVYNTYSPPSNPGPGDVCLISLPQDNAYMQDPKPDFGTIRAASESNRRVLMYAQSASLAGKLVSYVRPSQAVFLLGMAYDLSSGNCGDLASFTCDFGYNLEDGSCSPVYRRTTGNKCNVSFAMQNTAQGCLMLANVDFQGCGASPLPVPGANPPTPGAYTGADFPQPSASAYPDNERPYAFQDCAGELLIGGNVVTDYSALSFDFGNIIKAYRGETYYPTRSTYRGRDPKLTINHLLKSTLERIDYETIVGRSIGLTFTDGASSLVFTFNTKNFKSDVQDNRPLDDFFTQSVTFENFVDTAAGTDFTLAINYTAPTS